MRLWDFRSVNYHFLGKLYHCRKYGWLRYLSNHIISLLCFLFYHILESCLHIIALVVFWSEDFSLAYQTFEVEHIMSVILDFVRKVTFLLNHLILLYLIYQRTTLCDRSV